LETGVSQREAIGLYERMGYRKIAPFGDYPEDPLSFFYEKQIV
jgi:ribosomal protein S18 acetylase RimI-like enzyme